MDDVSGKNIKVQILKTLELMSSERMKLTPAELAVGLIAMELYLKHEQGLDDAHMATYIAGIFSQVVMSYQATIARNLKPEQIN